MTCRLGQLVVWVETTQLLRHKDMSSSSVKMCQQRTAVSYLSVQTS